MTPHAQLIASRRTSPYLELVGPVYQHRDEPSVIALELDERHTNAPCETPGKPLPGRPHHDTDHRASSVPPAAEPGSRVAPPFAEPGGDWRSGPATSTTTNRLVFTATAVFAVTIR